MIEIVNGRIDIAKVFESVRDERAGGNGYFIGTIRREQGIKGLDYECYVDMAKKKMREIVEISLQRWNLTRASVVHRIGWIPVGEEAVVIAVSSPHRKESFEACQFIIDTIKQEVPIWKGGGKSCCAMPYY